MKMKTTLGGLIGSISKRYVSQRPRTLGPMHKWSESSKTLHIGGGWRGFGGRRNRKDKKLGVPGDDMEVMDWGDDDGDVEIADSQELKEFQMEYLAFEQKKLKSMRRNEEREAAWNFIQQTKQQRLDPEMQEMIEDAKKAGANEWGGGRWGVKAAQRQARESAAEKKIREAAVSMGSSSFDFPRAPKTKTPGLGTVERLKQPQEKVFVNSLLDPLKKKKRTPVASVSFNGDNPVILTTGNLGDSLQSLQDSHIINDSKESIIPRGRRGRLGNDDEEDDGRTLPLFSDLSVKRKRPVLVRGEEFEDYNDDDEEWQAKLEEHIRENLKQYKDEFAFMDGNEMDDLEDETLAEYKRKKAEESMGEMETPKKKNLPKLRDFTKVVQLEDSIVLRWTKRVGPDGKGKRKKCSATLLTGRLRFKEPKSLKVLNEISASVPFKQIYSDCARGMGILWEGDFEEGKALYLKVKDRTQQAKRKGSTPLEQFHIERLLQAQAAQTSSMVFVELGKNYGLTLPRAPNCVSALREAFGVPEDKSRKIISYKELLGVLSWYEWKKKGIELPQLSGGKRIHANYGVFPPTRNEYVQLLKDAELPSNDLNLVIDVGTGTGVLSILMAQRGAKKIIATDVAEKAVACAKENVESFGLTDTIEVINCNIFPADEVQADLIVCNPPWIPAKPHSHLDQGSYDLDSIMLQGFIARAPRFLKPNGQIFLILSDLPERIGLRTREELLKWIDLANLKVVSTSTQSPTHDRAFQPEIPNHPERAQELVHLFRLEHKN